MVKVPDQFSETYMILGPMQKETVESSKLRILSPFEKNPHFILENPHFFGKILNFWKNPVATEKFITQSNPYCFSLIFCKHPHFVSIKRLCNKK